MKSFQRDTIYHRDRGARGGGVLIAVDKSVSSQLIDCPKELELLLIQIGLKHPTRICLVYNPPNSCIEYKQSLIAFLDNLATNPSPLILMGDFNVPDINWDTLSGSSTFSNQLCDLLFQYNLSQIVDCSTHVAGGILDLIFTNCASHKLPGNPFRYCTSCHIRSLSDFFNFILLSYAFQPYDTNICI